MGLKRGYDNSAESLEVLAESELNSRNERFGFVSKIVAFYFIAQIFHVKEEFKGIFLPQLELFSCQYQILGNYYSQNSVNSLFSKESFLQVFLSFPSLFRVSIAEYHI